MISTGHDDSLSKPRIWASSVISAFTGVETRTVGKACMLVLPSIERPTASMQTFWMSLLGSSVCRQNGHRWHHLSMTTEYSGRPIQSTYARKWSGATAGRGEYHSSAGNDHNTNCPIIIVYMLDKQRCTHCLMPILASFTAILWSCLYFG